MVFECQLFLGKAAGNAGNRGARTVAFLNQSSEVVFRVSEQILTEGKSYERRTNSRVSGAQYVTEHRQLIFV